jgi:uncharacterized protein (DUF1800 family)
MDRRKLLSKFLTSESKVTQLEEDTRPLTFKRANHLLRRMAFQPSIEEINYFIGKTPTEAVNLLLGDGQDYLPQNSNRLPNPDSDLNFIDDPMQNPKSVPNPLSASLEGQMNGRYRQVVDWIINIAASENYIQGSVSEKLTHFLMSIWCIEFTYDGDYQIPANSLILNNQTLRKYRLGSYIDIAKEMTLDGAMLLYQSAHLSRKEAPNENYARELLELFTMGIGHYSEGDIQEIAKIMTGWRTSPFLGDPHRNGYFQTWLDSDAHYTGSKRVFNIEFPALTEQENNEFKVKTNEIYKLIEGLFEIRGEAISKFICDKIFKYFVYSNPNEVDQDVIDQLSQTMITNNYSLLPVYKQLFTSTYFYEDANIGCQIKTPLEFLFGMQRLFGKSLEKPREALTDLEQVIYEPPNVSGWIGYRTWISTTTYPVRVDFAYKNAQSLTNEELSNLVDQIYNKQNMTEFMNELLLSFYAKDLEMSYFNKYFNIFNSNNINDTNWTTSVSNKTNNFLAGLRQVIVEIVQSPLFNLC